MGRQKYPAEQRYDKAPVDHRLDPFPSRPRMSREISKLQETEPLEYPPLDPAASFSFPLPFPPPGRAMMTTSIRSRGSIQLPR